MSYLLRGGSRLRRMRRFALSKKLRSMKISRYRLAIPLPNVWERLGDFSWRQLEVLSSNQGSVASVVGPILSSSFLDLMDFDSPLGAFRRILGIRSLIVLAEELDQ